MRVSTLPGVTADRRPYAAAASCHRCWLEGFDRAFRPARGALGARQQHRGFGDFRLLLDHPLEDLDGLFGLFVAEIQPAECHVDTDVHVRRATTALLEMLDGARTSLRGGELRHLDVAVGHRRHDAAEHPVGVDVAGVDGQRPPGHLPRVLEAALPGIDPR
jgi:hypothetical protein